MIRIPRHLWPATAGDLYRIVTSVPRGMDVQIVAIEGTTITYINLRAVPR